MQPGYFGDAGGPILRRSVSPTITPTVGRIVWFYPNTGQPGYAVPEEGQPLAAIIARVWNDFRVNLTVFDAIGSPVCALGPVPLIQAGQDTPASGHFATWMPYQLGQAKKAEGELTRAVEPKVSGARPNWGGTGLDFGTALLALKDGKRVARAGWNGKGMFVYLVPANAYPAQTGAAKAFFGEGGMVPYNAYLAIKGPDNTVSTWAPSGSDALAEDWQTVE